MASSIPTTGPKAARRARISEVATSLFLQRGFEDVSIAEIAERSGVSKMTVTNHFPLKEDLVFDEFVGELAQIAAALDGAADVPSAVDALEGYCRARENAGPVFRALRGIDGVSTWPRFAGMILASRALTARFHGHYLDVRDAVVVALDGRVEPDRLLLAAWLGAETVHLVDWWPVEAIQNGVPVARIATGRVLVRKRAFAALRNGIAGGSANSAAP